MIDEKFLRTKMKQWGIPSIKALANLAGIKYTTLIYNLDSKNTRIQIVAQLALFFGVSLEMLLIKETRNYICLIENGKKSRKYYRYDGGDVLSYMGYLLFV